MPHFNELFDEEVVAPETFSNKEIPAEVITQVIGELAMYDTTNGREHSSKTGYSTSPRVREVLENDIRELPAHNAD